MSLPWVTQSGFDDELTAGPPFPHLSVRAYNRVQIAQTFGSLAAVTRAL